MNLSFTELLEPFLLLQYSFAIILYNLVSMIRFDSYTSVDKIPVLVWERFVSKQAVGLEINHLRAVEKSRINDIHPYYLIGFDENVPIGIAYCFSIQVDIAQMSDSYPQKVLDIVKCWMPGFLEVRIVELGHIASLGTTIEVLPGYLDGFLIELSKKIDDIARLENADLCLIRDLPTTKCKDYSVLDKVGFQAFKGFPIARMKLNWNSFEDYLADLKSKRRKNILQKREKLNVEEISVEVIEDYAPYADKLSELWSNVAKSNNGYSHEKLTPEYFRSMSLYMNGRSHVVAIKRKGEIVAYGLNLIGDEEYFGMAEGMDYTFRDQYDLYANSIFESLSVACLLGKRNFNIGITTYDFKLSIGAQAEPCTYFLKAIKNECYTAVYTKIIEKSIGEPEKEHRVFKKEIFPDCYQSQGIETFLNSKRNEIDPFNKHYRYTRVDQVRAANLYTYCQVFESAQEPVIRHQGRGVIMLGTNSYLGLANHPKVKQAAHEAIEKYGSACSGSPLLNGTLDLHQKLSVELSKFLGKQDALLFSTGYQTNLGAISALVGRGDVLIMDERNHASLVDGARLSRAELVRYKHNNIESLEKALDKHADRPKLIVTDSLFSMEGTIINLLSIVELAKKYHARLMLDESHAIGVMGKNGKGVAELYGLSDEVDVIMGTFSKSLASIGGFIAGDRKLIDTLKHTSRSHIFSASLPPSAVAVVRASLQIVEQEPERRQQLLNNARYLASGLKELGFNVCDTGSPIIPLFCGHELLTVAAFHKLFDAGVFVNPVTSPAVPKNHEILRISVMATHTEEVLMNALELFKELKTKNWP